MGTLYEHKNRQLTELRQTYHGILLILRHFISKDKYTENHSYRVSVYATKIASSLGLDAERLEDVRAAPCCTTSASSTLAARFSTRRRD